MPRSKTTTVSTKPLQGVALIRPSRVWSQRDRSVGVAGVFALTMLLLAGCGTPTPTPALPNAEIGESVTCPGEFLQYLAKERTIEGMGVDVEELTAEVDPLGFPLPEEPTCAAIVQGQRVLPSGATEPAEQILLVPGAVKAEVDSAAREAGYIDGAGWTLVTDSIVLSTIEKTATQLGIPGTDTYTLLSATHSNELAKLRASTPPRE